MEIICHVLRTVQDQDPITQIIIYKDEAWVTITDLAEVEQHLIWRNQEHFCQAYSTMFTVPPIIHILYQALLAGLDNTMLCHIEQLLSSSPKLLVIYNTCKNIHVTPPTVPSPLWLYR